MKHSHRLLFVVIALMSMLLMMGAGEPNILKNTNFSMDENDLPVDWNQIGEAEFSYITDAEGGSIIRMQMDQGGFSRVVQNVAVEGEKIYCIRFNARVENFTGASGAYAEIPDVLGAQSDKVISDEWQTIELYGMTAPDQQILPISFAFGSGESGDIGTAEFSNVQVFMLTDTLPSDANYVWFYDRETWVANNPEEAEEESAASTGATIAVVIAVAYAMVIIVMLNYGVFNPNTAKPGRKYNSKVWIVILGGTAISMFFAATQFGHMTDVTDFSVWAQQLNELGITNFYSSDIWCDYPPGYMYVLYIVGAIAKLFGFAVQSIGFTFLIKLPAIISDAATAYFLYRIAREYVGEKIAFLIAGIMALNPMVIFDSAYWGQIDSILALCIVGSFWAYYKNNKIISAVLFIVGLLVKPQMLIMGPVLLFAFLRDLISKDWKKELKTLVLAILAAAGVLVVMVLPFSIGMDATWLIDKYITTAEQYPYATVNAYNFYALIGQNWGDYINSGIAGISFQAIGNAAIVIISLLTGFHIFRSKERKAVFSGGVFMTWGIFCFAHSMHERYMFPVLILSAICFAIYRDKRYLYLMLVSTIGQLANCVVAMDHLHLVGLNPLVIAISTINMLGFIYCAYIVWTTETKEMVLAIEGPTEDSPVSDTKPGSPRVVHTGLPKFIRVTNRQGERMMPMDYVYMLIITVVYSLVAMINLGSTQVPENYWRTKNPGESLTVHFKEQVMLSNAYYYAGVGKGTITFELTADDQYAQNTFTTTLEEGQMYKWQTYPVSGMARDVTIIATEAGMFINEMAFYDDTGNMVEIESVTPGETDFEEVGDCGALFDEQHLVDPRPDYMTEMYFDEIYHARTAFEHLNGMAPYENSHPPLGKVFIMLGIWIFGMNPFGWRIIGTIFGICMLPLMYVFAKRIFKDSRFAVMATLLFALDGMHFVQTRIATIDVYGVFFIMAMCYYMYRYWQMNFYVDSLRKTFVPLGLSGIMFGIGIASKWIGFYAGAGLAVALFTTFGFRYAEYRKARNALEEGSETDTAFLEKVVGSFRKNVLYTCLFCVGFFIIIPAAIYLLSYLPYFLCAEDPYNLEKVWGVQKFMFSYHSQLTATHPFQSPWWQWPIIFRPIYYFSGKHMGEGMVQSIAAFGNPAVWWTGLVCTIICLVMMLFRDKKLEEKTNTGFLLICLGGALLPWVFITRATFIYHYFASVPFIILLTAMCAKRFVNARGRIRIPFYAVIVAAFVLFGLFYPVWSGWPINREFALTYIQWMDSWWFF